MIAKLICLHTSSIGRGHSNSKRFSMKRGRSNGFDVVISLERFLVLPFIADQSRIPLNSALPSELS